MRATRSGWRSANFTTLGAPENMPYNRYFQHPVLIVTGTGNSQIICTVGYVESNIFLRDETGTQVDHDNDGRGSPAMVSAFALSSGRWSSGVLSQTGATNYELLIDTID